MKNWLTIGEMSEKTGLSHKALRLYEQKGLLIPHDRSESNYRYYHEKQLTQALRIVELKGLGFLLDEIKFILQNTNELNLKTMVEQKIKAYENQLTQTNQVIHQLKNILSSLENHQALNQVQRGQIMENLFETTKSQFNRKGIPVKGEVLDRLNNELNCLPTELKSVLTDFVEVIEYAKNNNILLGPGRGSSASSLILYAMGYTPINPLKYGLVPELFVQTKNIWIDVEYSNSSEIGNMCDELSRKHQFEIVAFRAPYLDIFKKKQNQFGRVEFNEISDFDPMVLNAPMEMEF